MSILVEFPGYRAIIGKTVDDVAVKEKVYLTQSVVNVCVPFCVPSYKVVIVGVPLNDFK